MNLAKRLRAMALLTLAPAALAQAPREAPRQPQTEAPAGRTPVGRWTFETGMVTPNCKLSGEMQVLKADKAGFYSCHFVAVQSCTGWDAW